MSDRRKSILDKLFECVNNGVDWGVSQVKNPCPPRKKLIQKKTDSGIDTEKKMDSEVFLENENQTRIEEDQDFQNKMKENPNTRIGEGPDIKPCKPNQVCPNENDPPCCDIPMQDPYRPPCEPKEEEPCPPKKSYLDEPREPTCNCDCCKKNVHAKGCVDEQTNSVKENNGIRLEQA